MVCPRAPLPLGASKFARPTLGSRLHSLPDAEYISHDAASHPWLHLKSLVLQGRTVENLPTLQLFCA